MGECYSKLVLESARNWQLSNARCCGGQCVFYCNMKRESAQGWVASPNPNLVQYAHMISKWFLNSGDRSGYQCMVVYVQQRN